MFVARPNDLIIPALILHGVICLGLALTPSARPKQDPNINFEGLVRGVRMNVWDGAVSFERNNARDKATTGLVIEDGDRVFSERSSRAELLLQPGNYLRLASDTQLKFLSTAYDKLRLELASGSVNFELLNDPWVSPLTEAVGRYDLIRTITPAGEILIVQPALIRISVTTDNTVEVVVRSGTAILDGQFIKSKKVGRKKDGVLTISDRNPKIEDDFDSWCRSRAEQLLKMNRALKKDPLWVKTHEDGKEPTVNFDDSDEETTRSPYVVSAKPGTVVFADDGVEILHGKSDWHGVDEKTDLKAQDRLRTGPYSRIELSIFPDILLRLDQNSELLLDALTNEEVTLRLVHGAMIVDAAIFKQKNLPPIRIGGVSTLVTIADNGNYRVEVNSKADQLTVREGRVLLSGHTVGSCRILTNSIVSDCGKKRNDNFDYWSQSRGEGVSFTERSMASALLRQRKTDLRERGFWYLVTGSQQFTFVPFYVKNFQSPYGGEYSVALTSKQRPLRMPMPRTFGNPVPGRPYP